MILIMLISLSLFNLNALADEVDPIGADPGFKSIQFQAIILDKIKYPTYLAEGQIDEASFMFSSSQYDGRLHFEKLKPETTPTTLVSDVYTVYETVNIIGVFISLDAIDFLIDVYVRRGA